MKKQKLKSKNRVVVNKLGIWTAWIYGLAIGSFFMWLPLLPTLTINYDYISLKERLIFSLICLVIGIILGFFGFILGTSIIDYFEKTKLSRRKILLWAGISLPINFFMNILAYIIYLLLITILSIVYGIFYSKRLVCLKDKNKMKKISIFYLVFLQVLGILVGVAFVISSMNFDIQGDVASIVGSEVVINDSSKCISINDYYQSDWGRVRPLHIIGCSKKIRVYNHTKYYDWVITSSLRYKNGTYFSIIDGETFYATAQNNYTMVIPIEFEGGEVVDAKFKLYIEHVEYPYPLILLLSFTPGILLIIVLLIYQIKSKFIK